VVVQQQPAPQPVIIHQQPAPQPVIIHQQAAPQPVIIRQQPAPQQVIIHQQAPARRFVYRSPSVHLHLADISSEFDTLVAQHQLVCFEYAIIIHHLFVVEV
jgi:hypothetical protein